MKVVIMKQCNVNISCIDIVKQYIHTNCIECMNCENNYYIYTHTICEMLSKSTKHSILIHLSIEYTKLHVVDVALYADTGDDIAMIHVLVTRSIDYARLVV
jgi:hypothetical protein